MTRYKISYRMEPPKDAGDVLFVVYKDISRYTQQDPYEWLVANKAEWAGKKILSIEMID